jgi:hypothetical protein
VDAKRLHALASLGLSRFAPFSAVLLLGSAACSFEPPAVDPPMLEPKDAEAPERGSIDATEGADAGLADSEGGDDAGKVDDAGMNRPPVAAADTATTAPGIPIDIPALANDSDPDGDSITIRSIDAPSSGTATVTAAGVRYTPGAVEGTVRFGYQIEDGRGGEATAEITVFVVADPLVLFPFTAEINLNSRGSFNASGGVPPYTYRIASGTGEIDSATGEFFSAGVPGRALITVEDAIGQASSSTVTFGNGDLFFMGGLGPLGDEEEVFRSNDGFAWQPSGMLSAPLYLHSAVVFEDRIYVGGGRNDSFEVSQLLLVSSDGNNFVTGGMLPIPLRGTKLVVFRQRLFLLGGRDGAGANRDEVWSSTDGTNWIVESRLPDPRAYGSAFVYDGELWYAGGFSTEARAEMWSSPDGVTWSDRGSLPQPRLLMADAIHLGQMWFMGGSANGDDGVVEVRRTSDAQGFADGDPLPAVNAGAAAIHWHRELWVVGGGNRVSSFNYVPYDSVVTLDPNGQWVQPGTLPFGRLFGALVIFAP